MNPLTKSEKLNLIRTLGVQEGIKAILKRDISDEWPEGKTLADMARQWGTHRSIISDILVGGRPKHRVRARMALEVGLTWDEIRQAAAEQNQAA